jgi:flagellar hook protein FlgE
VSLFSNLHTASSGLNVSATSMNIIGDNIANVNTIGYKRTRASFADSFPMSVAYVHGPVSIGTGAYVGKTTSLFGQGSLQASGNALDMALNGNGFFAVREDNCLYYTRNGEFFLDDSGFLTNSSGLRVQGYTANDTGYIKPTIGDLQVAIGSVSSQETDSVFLTANLESDSDFSTTPVQNMTLDGLTETIDVVTQAADYSTSISVYDSLGDKHDLTIVFEKVGINQWEYNVIADAGEIADPTSIGYQEEFAFKISSGTLDFNTDGDLINFTQVNQSATSAWEFEGATSAVGNDMLFDFGLVDDGTGNLISSGNATLTQLASESTVTSIDQDGFGVGHLANLEVRSDGTIVGIYDNGQDLNMGRVTIATFDTSDGLERVGSNLFRAHRIPGEPSFGIAGDGGRGDIFGANLEASNVDIEDEFINMITAQRSYQANSRVLSSTNELLRELVNLV